MKICLVKQHTTYDLYTKTGSDLRTMVASSNWRSGPVGLWEGFDCDFRIVWESRDRECQIGKGHWSQYVQGWKIWPEGSEAETVGDVDWGLYDAVISIDIAVPTRIVRQYPRVMWCYYFIEAGPQGIDGEFRGSPYYGYNVFLNHRLCKRPVTAGTAELAQIRDEKRCVLDFPYYLLSSHSIQNLYPELAATGRQGLVFSHHSYGILSDEERQALLPFGPIRGGYRTIADIHKLEMASRYYVVHPKCRAVAGTGVIEAISAGCLVLAPRRLLWGFPELLSEDLDYDDFAGLVGALELLERDPSKAEAERRKQAEKVELWCYRNPVASLEAIYSSLSESKCKAAAQHAAERWAYLRGRVSFTGFRAKNLIKRLCRRLQQRRDF
ncbi:MAG: glycosyltransferase [Verrucomicrobia bacterium]|nr:glycosyltransferase [Verrucomicrobiota bacterium]